MRFGSLGIGWKQTHKFQTIWGAYQLGSAQSSRPMAGGYPRILHTTWLFHMGPLTIRESWNQKTMQKKWVPLSVCSIKQIHRTAKSHDLSSFSPFKLAILGYSPFWGRPLVIHTPLIYIYTYIHTYVYMQGTQWRKAKNMQARSPKNGPASQRKPKECFKRCRDAHAVLQQACEVELWLPQAMQRHVYSQRQYTGPWAQPPAPQDIKVAFALCKAATSGKAARLAFVSGNVDSWEAGPCLRAHIHIHHAEAALN